MKTIAGRILTPICLCIEDIGPLHQGSVTRGAQVLQVAGDEDPGHELGKQPL